MPDQPHSTRTQWPDGACELAITLQRRLSISERDWHALKAQRSRRAAEQLAGALVHLLSGDQPHSGTGNEARQRALALVEHARQWLAAEISDPGCPSHGR